MQYRKSKMRLFICSTFSFILTLLILILYLCLGFSFGVFNNQSVIKNLNKSNYYSEVYNQLDKDAKELISKAGFPVTVLEDVITFERVYVGGRNYVANTLSGNDADINTMNLREDLTHNIDTYLSEQGIRRTDEQNDGIDELISELEENYVSSIELEFINYYRDYKVKFINLIRIMLPILLLIIGGLCLCIFKLNRYKHRSLRYINYSFIASSLMVILFATYLLISKQYAKIDALPDFYNKFITLYLKWDIMVFLYMGGIGTIISITLITFTYYLRRQVAYG